MANKNTAAVVDEIIEPSMSDIDAILEGMEETDASAAPAESEVVNELELEAAVSAAERYEGAETETASESGDAPAEVTAEPAKKKERAPRMFFSKQSDRIAHRLGDKLGEYMLLEVGDAELSGEDLAARNKEVLTTIDGQAKKVGEKAAMLFKWMQNGGELNEVMKRAFTVLAKEGHLTSGDKGNLQANLLAKPYSLGTARSQSNQIFCLFRALKIANADGKGKLVPNPQSLILMRANTTLGL